MSGIVEPIADSDEVIADDDGVPPVHRRRLSRSYFTPPAVWCGPGDAARERDRRSSRRW